MSNLRKVNDDILKEWIECRESTLFPFTNDEDKKHDIYFDKFFENILRNVPERNRKYIKKQFDKMMKIFLIIFVIGERSIIGMDFVMECNSLVDGF